MQEAQHRVHMNLRPLEEVDLSGEVLLTERLGIRAANGKVRPIDNYHANGANDQTVCWERTEID